MQVCNDVYLLSNSCHGYIIKHLSVLLVVSTFFSGIKYNRELSLLSLSVLLYITGSFLYSLSVIKYDRELSLLSLSVIIYNRELSLLSQCYYTI